MPVDPNRLRDQIGRPVLAMAAAGALAAATLGLDAVVDIGPTLTADNARSLLAGSFAGVVTIGAFTFWMRPLAVQLAAGTLPPRTVADRLHDGFQQRVIAASVGALTYVTIVILGLPPPGHDAPTVSVITGGLVAVGAVLGLLVGMERAIVSTRPGRVLGEIASAVVDQICATHPKELPADESLVEPSPPSGPGARLTTTRTGWVRDIDEGRLLAAVPEATAVRLDTDVGAFVTRDATSLLTLWPAERATQVDTSEIREAFHLSEERGAGLDVAGGLVHLVDIGVHAATGGSSSPSLVYEALRQVGAVLHELVRREVPLTGREHEGGRVLIHGHRPDHGELVELAVDRFRRVVAHEPVMAIELIRMLLDVRDEAVRQERASAIAAIDEQLDLTVAQCRHSRPLPVDLRRVEAARRGETGPMQRLSAGYQVDGATAGDETP